MRLAPRSWQVAVWTALPPAPYVGLDQKSGGLVGAGNDLLVTIRSDPMAMEDYMAPASRQVEAVRDRFFRLAHDWKQTTAYCSSVTKMSMHPAYQQIIGMGEKAVPLILGELAREPDHWFWALHAITGTNPAANEDAGNVDRMAKSWLDWGRVRGYFS